MKIIILFILIIGIFGCQHKDHEESDKIDDGEVKSIDHINKPNVRFIDSGNNDELYSATDLTSQIIIEIGSELSGSWMLPTKTIDGTRLVSWGNVPISNQSYFIIDLLGETKYFIKGHSEGGKKGFDSIKGIIQTIKVIESGVFKIEYIDELDNLSKNKIRVLQIEYLDSEDVLSIIELEGRTLSREKLIRISERIDM